MNLNGFTGKVINEIIVKDLDLLEKTPVHEVVDIGDSDEEAEVNIHQFILKNVRILYSLTIVQQCGSEI